ncbi:MAG: HK97 family phage prohead protease, partial [Deltaproteobacteria bacterium]|nr:HK97 family phage prohead protease [Deltaproteobacteria bacterium]
DYVLGRNKTNTLILREDEKGLRVEIDPPESQWAKDVMISVERGDVDGMSFAFIADKDSWDETGEVPVRTLEKVKMFEVSPCTFPAYRDTEIAVRSYEKWKKEQSDGGTADDDLSEELRTQRAEERKEKIEEVRKNVERTEKQAE